MNRLKNFFKSKRLDNRGLTLIELLMAIAILAIIIVPVFGSFITSARVNMKARRTLAATNVAQTIFEGFADKTYEGGISGIMGQLNMGISGTLSGNNALSTLDNNYYNDMSHYVALPTDVFTINGVDIPDRNEFHFKGNTYSNMSDLISGNAVSINTVSFNQVVAQAANKNVVDYGADKALMGWSSGYGGALVYSGIEMENFRFDAVVTFLPMAQNTTDKYYTYCVTVTIYDAKQDDPALRFQDGALMDVMLGGIATK